MRVISIFVVLPTVWAMIFPQTVMAKETANTNTKIEFKVNETTGSNSLKNIPYNYEGYVPIKAPQEIKNEAILNKWKSRQRTINFPQGKFTINASAYTAAADECGKSDGITASGVKVHKGTLACPPQYPFGTKMKIEGYGTFVCEDRGGAIKGNKFDIYVKTKKEAFAFGRRNLLAEVVK